MVGMDVWFGQRVGEKRKRFWTSRPATSGPRADLYAQPMFLPSSSVVLRELGFQQMRWREQAQRVFVGLPLGLFPPPFQKNPLANSQRQNHHPQFHEQAPPMFLDLTRFFPPQRWIFPNTSADFSSILALDCCSKGFQTTNSTQNKMRPHLTPNPLNLGPSFSKIEKGLKQLLKGVSFQTPYLIVEPDSPLFCQREQSVGVTDELALPFAQKFQWGSSFCQ